MASLAGLYYVQLSTCMYFYLSIEEEILHKHPVLRALISDWLENSFIMAVFEKIFLKFSQNFLSKASLKTFSYKTIIKLCTDQWVTSFIFRGEGRRTSECSSCRVIKLWVSLVSFHVKGCVQHHNIMEWTTDLFNSIGFTLGWNKQKAATTIVFIHQDVSTQRGNDFVSYLVSI